MGQPGEGATGVWSPPTLPAQSQSTPSIRTSRGELCPVPSCYHLVYCARVLLVGLLMLLEPEGGGEFSWSLYISGTILRIFQAAHGYCIGVCAHACQYRSFCDLLQCSCLIDRVAHTGPVTALRAFVVAY
eukprot:1100447-Prymnesium_polylepis.1